MRHIELVDLQETARTLALFDAAEAQGFIDASEHSRLMFVAAAERAILRGTRNSCGLFRRLVEQKLWHHITQGDENAAHDRLKLLFYGDVRKLLSTRSEPSILAESKRGLIYWTDERNPKSDDLRNEEDLFLTLHR